MVIGGGIAGLACAWYLSKLSLRVTLVEAKRMGGWVHTLRTPHLLELGPRTLRPNGIAGSTVLDLVYQLGLSDQVIIASKDSSAAKNRFLAWNGRLEMLPSSLFKFITSKSSITKGLLLDVLKEPFIPRGSATPESIDSFISRRFGKRMSQNIVSAVIHGIYAGDHSRLEVESTMPSLKRMEQESGSVILGIVKSLMFPDKTKYVASCAKAEQFISSIQQKASMYTFQVS